MPPVFTPPNMVTNTAPSIGPAIPNIPAVRLSQQLIAVARSAVASEFPQITAQLCMLVLNPSQYAIIARIIIGQVWAKP